MEYLCKITTSSYVLCLKTILQNNQTSGIGDPALLEKLMKKKNVLKTWACLFLLCLHLATIFITIQQNVFSNTVLSLLINHICFTEASIEPITFLPIFHPFVLNWPLQKQVPFGSTYLQKLNHDKRNMYFFSHKSNF